MTARWLSLLALPTLLASSQAQELDSKLAKLVTEIEAKRIETHTPGLALAIVKDGKVILAKGFGYKDVRSKAPVTPDTQFAIGSATCVHTRFITWLGSDDTDAFVRATNPSFSSGMNPTKAENPSILPPC